MSQRLLNILLLSLLSSLALANNNYPTPIKAGMPGQKRGDIIAPLSDEQIAAWCDFSKQIVVTKTSVLCAFVGDKPGAASTTTALNKLPVKKLLAQKTSHPIPKDLTPNPYEMSEYGDT